MVFNFFRTTLQCLTITISQSASQAPEVAKNSVLCSVLSLAWQHDCCLPLERSHKTSISWDNSDCVKFLLPFIYRVKLRQSFTWLLVSKEYSTCLYRTEKIWVPKLVVLLGSAVTELHGFGPEPEKGEAPIFKRDEFQIELLIVNENTI